MRKILIVDDDAVSLSIARTLLEKDYEVATAKSGLQALGYLKENHNEVDIILLDVIMPGIGGMDILKTIRRTPDMQDISVIFMTSMEGVNFELEAMSNGVSEIAKKPVNADLLKMKIERQLKAVDLKKENRKMRQHLSKIQIQVNGLVREALEA